MALFEGSVAFVMIGAVMKSMDPSLEEASQVLGAGRVRTMLRITLPLVLPGVLGAAVFVFAEMLGSFSAALVLGLPSRFYVVTTAMYQLVSQYPPRFPTAAAMGVSLFAVMFAMVWIYRRIISSGSYVTITGKAFRPRVMDVGGLRWPLLGLCLAYLLVAVVLPVLVIVYASFQRLSGARDRAHGAPRHDRDHGAARGAHAAHRDRQPPARRGRAGPPRPAHRGGQYCPAPRAHLR
jgi:iron(III) transport system permease protein